MGKYGIQYFIRGCISCSSGIINMYNKGQRIPLTLESTYFAGTY